MGEGWERGGRRCVGGERRWEKVWELGGRRCGRRCVGGGRRWEKVGEGWERVLENKRGCVDGLERVRENDRW